MMSIRHRLIFMMTGLSLTAVLLTVSAITAYLIYDIRHSKMQELALTATMIGERNSASLAFLDSQRVQQNLDIFRLSPEIMTACVYNAVGTLFAGYQAEQSGDNALCPTNIDALTQARPDLLTTLQPIRQNGESIGSMFMAADTRAVDAYMRKSIEISGTVALLVCALTLLFTVRFQRGISEPILELAATVQSITLNRDYGLAAKQHYSGETGILARAFNDMLSEVRKRDRELMHTNETLEQRVVERTREFEDATRKAEAANEAKSEFLRNMSHEFRTPLHAIISFSAYGIKEYAKTPRGQLKQYFDLIQNGSQRLSRLVNEVLDLASIEHGEHRFLLQKGDLCELAARSADMVRPLLEDKHITLAFEQSQAAPVLCDHDKIVQVITNLLGNAVKFTPSGKRITLHIEHANEAVSLSVRDEGIGIPEEETEMIFESFRQSSRTNTGAGGTGLGLAICRGIVGAHEGRIWAENNKGSAGACVTFSLPVAHSMEARHETAA